MSPALLIIINGLLALVSVAAFSSLWFGHTPGGT
jgi:hypothetical protein